MYKPLIRKRKSKENGTRPCTETKLYCAIHPIFDIVHSIDLVMFSRGTTSPLLKMGRGLFLGAASCELETVGETWHPFEMKLWSFAIFFSFNMETSDTWGSTAIMPLQSLTLIASFESSSPAASNLAEATVWSSRALQAFSRIDWRYLACASIRSWRQLWTCFVQNLEKEILLHHSQVMIFENLLNKRRIWIFQFIRSMLILGERLNWIMLIKKLSTNMHHKVGIFPSQVRMMCSMPIRKQSLSQPVHRCL